MFKDTFSNLLQSKNLSPYKVSKDTKIPKSIVYEWASGEREPISEYLIILADYLNVSIDYLLGRTNCPDMLKYDENDNHIIIEAKDKPLNNF